VANFHLTIIAFGAGSPRFSLSAEDTDRVFDLQLNFFVADASDLRNDHHGVFSLVDVDGRFHERSGEGAAGSTDDALTRLLHAATNVVELGGDVRGAAGHVSPLPSRLYDHFHLDGDVHGQLRHANGAPSVHALLTEQVQQQARSTVHDHMLLVEARGAIDEAQELDDATDTIEVADLFLKGAQAVDDTEPGGLLRGRYIYVRADLTRDYAIRANGTRAGDEHEVARAGGAGVLAVRTARRNLDI